MNQIIQRATSVIFYTLPLKASLPFGMYFVSKYFFLKAIFYYLLLPINLVESLLQYGGLGAFSNLILFLILFAAVVRNPNVPYFVRYSACQALLLDIALIIMTYLLRILPLVEFGSIVFISILSIFIFSIFQCINGVEPEIPFISKSVRMQI